MRTKEEHRIGRVGWLRAAVLGANDGILSTASLLLGVPGRDAAGEACGGLRSSEAQDVALRCLSGNDRLVDIHTKYLKMNAYLRE